MGRIENKFKILKEKGEKAAKEAAFSPAMEGLTRLGYAVKGFIYVAIGFLAEAEWRCS